MEDAHVKEQTDLLVRLKQWAFGNGATGAAKKLEELEDEFRETTAGNKECQAMKDMNEHSKWHTDTKRFRLAVLIPLYLMFAGTVVTVIAILSG